MNFCFVISLEIFLVDIGVNSGYFPFQLSSLLMFRVLNQSIEKLVCSFHLVKFLPNGKNKPWMTFFRFRLVFRFQYSCTSFYMHTARPFLLPITRQKCDHNVLLQEQNRIRCMYASSMWHWKIRNHIRKQKWSSWFISNRLFAKIMLTILSSNFLWLIRLDCEWEKVQYIFFEI